MRAIILGLAGVLTGTILGRCLVPVGVVPIASELVADIRRGDFVTGPSRLPDAAGSSMSVREAVPEGAAATERETSLLGRIGDLEARLAAVQRAKESRLAADRLRARSRVREAVAAQALRYGSHYFDLSDFIAVPSLIAERPVEFAEGLERLVIDSGVYRTPELEEGVRGCREVELEPGQESLLHFAHYERRRGCRTDGVGIQLRLPKSLPLGHPSHSEYSLSATFGADGAISCVRLGRENGPAGDIGLRLSRREDGSIGIEVAKAARSLKRSPQELARIHAALTACAQRLANLAP